MTYNFKPIKKPPDPNNPKVEIILQHDRLGQRSFGSFEHNASSSVALTPKILAEIVAERLKSEGLCVIAFFVMKDAAMIDMGLIKNLTEEAQGKVIPNGATLILSVSDDQPPPAAS